MKRFVKVLLVGLPVVTSIMFTGCQGSSKGAPSCCDSTQILKSDTTLVADTLSSEVSAIMQQGVVLERVQTIYSLIKQECTYIGGSVDNDMLDKMFCSKSWNQLLMAVRRQEFLTNTLFFEVNHWTMSHDNDLVRFEEFEVKNCVFSESDKRAQVDFTVYEANTYTPARIELVYEDGQWKIDNFYHLKYMLNLRERMMQYLDDRSLAFLL